MHVIKFDCNTRTILIYAEKTYKVDTTASVIQLTIRLFSFHFSQTKWAMRKSQLSSSKLPCTCLTWSVIGSMEGCNAACCKRWTPLTPATPAYLIAQLTDAWMKLVAPTCMGNDDYWNVMGSSSFCNNGVVHWKEQANKVHFLAHPSSNAYVSSYFWVH